MIAVIDYGAGNLHSVKNALDYLGADSIVTDDKDIILSADKVILPGVGAFGDSMDNIRSHGLFDVVKEALESDKPFLGICLGLQLLFDRSDETPGAKGLKIPHMGWNSLTYNKDSKLFHGIGEEPFVYFVHSYYIVPDDESVVSAYTEYGTRLPVAAERKNVYAVQFHPEKSGKTGMKILTNFIKEV